MKKKIVTALLAISTLLAEETKIIPYVGEISYDKELSKSLKKDASFFGFYANVAEDDYAVEMAYNYLDVEYKESVGVDNLKQYDFSLLYNKYYRNYMLKVGVHYINNNEAESFRDLGNGYVGMAGVAGYNYFGDDKFTYGVEAYYSVYLEAHDDTTNSVTKMIDVVQFSPYLMYSKVMTKKIRNDLTLKLNAIASTQYKDPGYLSFEISDTVVYKGFYSTLQYIGGEMKSGVLDGGLYVMNTKNLLKNSYSLKLGLYVTPRLALDASYYMNSYQEYNAATLKLAPEGKNSIALVSLSCKF